MSNIELENTKGPRALEVSKKSLKGRYRRTLGEDVDDAEIGGTVGTSDVISYSTAKYNWV